MDETRLIVFVAVFSALNFAVASLNRYIPLGGALSGMGGISPAHMVIDAILCTAIMLTAACAADRFGVASFIGVVTGILMVMATGAKPPALVSWPIRGFVLDIVVFKIFSRHTSFKPYCIAAFLAFLLQTVVGKTLYLLISMPAKIWVILLKSLFLPLALAGSVVSILGAYIAYKKLIPITREVLMVGV